MIASGHMQTMYSVIGDFTQVDQIEYERWAVPSEVDWRAVE